jgi:hypothetical protein
MAGAVRNLKWVLTGEDKSASKSIEGVHGKLAKLGAALAGGALGAGAIEFGKKAVEAAVEGQEAQARLAQAVKNTGGSMEELEPKVAALSGRFAKLGFTNDEVEGALAQLTTSLRSPAKAMDAMGLAADLAKFKHISLADASLTVAKAMEGQLRPLKQLGIDLPVAAGGALKLEHAHTAVAKAQEKVNDVLAKYPDALDKASKHHAQYENAVQGVTIAQDKLAEVQGAAQAITKGLAAAVGGQATASANTYAGKMAALHAQFANFQETVGTKLLPVLVKLMSGLSRMASFVERNQKVIKPLATVVGILGGGLLVLVKVTKMFTAVQAALDVVLSANPIGLVVIAVAALVGGLILAYKHSETFRKIVNGAFSAIAGAAKAMWGVIRPVLKAWADAYLFVIGAIVHGAAAAFGWVPGIGGKLKTAAKEFDKFKTAVNNSLDGITPTKTITITALTASQTAAGVRAIQAQDAGRGASQRAHRGVTEVHTHVHLDGKQIAHTVTRQQTSLAQRGHLNPGQV